MTVTRPCLILRAAFLLLACTAALAGCTGTNAEENGSAAPVLPEATPSLEVTQPTPSSGGQIGEEEARSLAASALEREVPGMAITWIKLDQGGAQGKIWRFNIETGSDPEREGEFDVDIDATSGEMVTFRDYRGHSYRHEEGPAITLDEAEETAVAYLRDRDGDVNVIQIRAGLFEYETPLGKRIGPYEFVYKHEIDGILCSGDDITVGVDAIDGRVIEYMKTWKISEDDTRADPNPTISEAAAQERALEYLRETYPSGAIAVRSAELLWIKPEKWPGVDADWVDSPVAVRLIWWIEFDDEWYRSQEPPRTAVLWMDAHSGEVTYVGYTPRKVW